MSTTVVIRNLDPGVKQKLRSQAARHQRSMEAEIRAILAEAVRRPDSPAASLTPAQRALHSMEQTIDAPLSPALVAQLQRRVPTPFHSPRCPAPGQLVRLPGPPKAEDGSPVHPCSSGPA